MTFQTRPGRLPGIATFVLACTLFAALPTSAEHAEPVDEMLVVYPPPAMLVTQVPSEIIRSGRARNLSEAVGEIPGVDGVRRGANGLEPVIRGLGWERVPIEVDGLPIMGAGPARMDTPASLFGPAALQKIEVFKGLSSVTLGPGGTGGRVRVSTDYERSADEIVAGVDVHGEARATYDSVGDRFGGVAFVQGGTEKLDAHLGVDGGQSHDYEAPRHTEVPNSGKTASGVLALGYRPTESQRIWANYIDSNYWDEDFPSLPMDVDRGSMRIGSAGHRWRQDEGLIAETRVRAGLAIADHRMNNFQKPSPMMPMLRARIKGEAESYYAAAETRLRLPPLFDSDFEVTTGVDFNYVSRDATRTRNVMMTESFDHLWPDAEQWDLGIFAEGRLELSPDWMLRVGGRYDRVEADANDVDDASLLGNTVRENYVAFHGPDAADVDDTHDIGATNLLIEWSPNPSARMYVGTGISSRAASTSERYFAFALTPGGFDVGNPTLDPEVKTELEVGAMWNDHHMSASVQAYYHWINDYILRTLVAMVDVNGDLIPDNIRSYVNTRAQIYGVEANLTLLPTSYLSLPVTLAFTRGRDVKANNNLPEIPPLDLRVAVRVHSDAPLPWWTEFGARIATKQDKVAASFGENETRGFEVFHLRGGIEAGRGFHFELGVENLFDEKYNHHLAREVPVPSGDLAAGSEVPAPGRSVYATVRFSF